MLEIKRRQFGNPPQYLTNSCNDRSYVSDGYVFAQHCSLEEGVRLLSYKHLSDRTVCIHLYMLFCSNSYQSIPASTVIWILKVVHFEVWCMRTVLER